MKDLTDKKTLQCRAEVVIDPLAIRDPRVVEIISHVADHYRESLTLKLMAEKLKLTPRHLSRLMKQHAITGFRETCRKVRMTKAGILLETGTPIKEVYKLCGYKSLSKFYRCFKKCHRMTPRAYQKLCLERYNTNHWLDWGIMRVEEVKGKRKSREVRRDLLAGYFG